MASLAPGSGHSAQPGAPPPRVDRAAVEGYLLAIAVFWIVQAFAWRPTEPYFNNDETRHVMSGVFFHDALFDLGMLDPIGYATAYFVQYPALSLLTWPPMYYLVEGLWFSVAGISVLSAKLLIGLHASLAAWFVHRLACRTFDRTTATFAVVLLVLGPLFVAYGRQVMLEMPTMAYAFGALWSFQRFLDAGRGRDVILAAAWAGAAALTRLDGFFVPLAFALMISASGSWRRTIVRPTVVAILVYGAMVVPWYALTAREIGWFHLKAIVEGTSPESTGFLAMENFWFYLRVIPDQVRWSVLAMSALGVVVAMRRTGWAACSPWLSIALATYAMATPVAELNARHTIYWTPVFAVFAAFGALTVGRAITVRYSRIDFRAPALALVAICALQAAIKPAPFVRGYADAARYVLEADPDARFVLFDGTLNGNFIYQVRRLDADRNLRVLRGDKLLYSVLSDPKAGYRSYVNSKDDVLRILRDYDPAHVVVEDPPVMHVLQAGELLRRALDERTDLYALERTIELESSDAGIRGKRLLVYRTLTRNPDARREVEFELWSIGRTLRSDGTGQGR